MIPGYVRTDRWLAGAVLYGLTLLGEVLVGIPARMFLAWMMFSILNAFGALDLNVGVLAWMVALLPIAWSLVALVAPGGGRVWRRQQGGRRPTIEEGAAVAASLDQLQAVSPDLEFPASWFVLDEPRTLAAVRGRTLMLSRGLLESDALTAALAHELGHIATPDGRLTEALNRLVLWRDPLALSAMDFAASPRAQEGVVTAFVAGALRWLVRFAGGSTVQLCLHGLWASYWRSREYVADAFAASLGQTEDLAFYLEEQELPFDAPVPYLLFNPADHPPVALRVEHLHRLAGVSD
jgi:Zn-dependent protease with chaperone function